jgi:ppGpp synthetase/RelA/SpoT-type nucleotidyltranferase
VTKIGHRIAAGTATLEDVTSFEKWRGAHAYVINTFQANLRRRSRGTSIAVGTRLKRRETILNKLRRFRQMQLGRMHDIAGCRLIFPDLKELEAFRTAFHTARFSHKRREFEGDKWNYIDHPKEDGYRGIHDVYEYNVSTWTGKAFNGLLIELQYRTLVQHTWATAVEVAGLLTHNNPKFGQGSPELIRFFSLASELLSRRYEERVSSLPHLSDSELISEFRRLEKDTRTLQLFRQVNAKAVSIDFKRNNVLVFPLVSAAEENASDLRIYSFAYVTPAIDLYNKLEKELAGRADVVLVRADSFQNMRLTFQNYFADTTDFVRMMDAIIKP